MRNEDILLLTLWWERFTTAIEAIRSMGERLHGKRAKMKNQPNPLTAENHLFESRKAGLLKKELERYTRNKKLFLLLAFFALSLNLRAPITSLPPIIQELNALFHINGGFAGFLTSIPVLCFGLLTPLIGFLIKNLRVETTVFLTLIGIALGTFIRSAGGIDMIVAGTVIIGASITVGNIAGLLVIGREFPDRISAMTGLYVCGMSVGAMGTMSLTAPLSLKIGWRPALALPVFMSLIAIVLWAVTLFFERKRVYVYNQLHEVPEKPAAPSSRKRSYRASTPSSSLLRQPLVWILAVAFACHTFLFYGFTAWLPAYLEQTLQMSDATAGVVASLFQILGNIGCFGIPLMDRTGNFSSRQLFMVVSLSWLTTAAGFWFAPRLWPIWLFFGGISGGGGFTVIFSMIMVNAKNLNENRSMSTVVQSAGYIIAAISPFAIGYFHEISGNWNGAMALLAGAGVVIVLSGLAATHRPAGRHSS